MGKGIDDPRNEYYKNLLNHPILSHSEERETLKLVAIGNIAAREKMVLHNLRLVFNIAAKNKSDLPLDDKFGAGCEALYRALDKFDLSKNMRFSTYAVPWIKQFIRRASFNSDSLSLPENIRGLLKKRDDFCIDYLHQHGISPSKSLLKNHLRKNMWQTTTDEALEFAISYKGTHLFNPLEPYFSITASDKVEKKAMDNITASEIHNILESILTPTEHYILMHRYSLNGKINPSDYAGRDEAIVSHRSIAHKLGVTRQRVQQIEVRILRRLKKYFEQEHLYDRSD